MVCKEVLANLLQVHLNYTMNKHITYCGHCCKLQQYLKKVCTGAYLRKIAPMASTKIAFYIYYLLIISPGIHV